MHLKRKAEIKFFKQVIYHWRLFLKKFHRKYNALYFLKFFPLNSNRNSKLFQILYITIAGTILAIYSYCARFIFSDHIVNNLATTNTTIIFTLYGCVEQFTGINFFVKISKTYHQLLSNSIFWYCQLIANFTNKLLLLYIFADLCSASSISNIAVPGSA